MNDFSSDESTDEEEINKNFETEAELIVETDTLPKRSVHRYILVYDNYQRWKQGSRNINLNLWMYLMPAFCKIILYCKNIQISRFCFW